MQEPPGTGRLVYIRSPAAVKRLALSYESLLADIYWIRAVQHYGGTKLSTDPNKQYDLLYPLLDLTTTLDPHFNIAYHFGAVFLSAPFPNGPGRPDQAIALLQKGLGAQPQRWEFAQAVGFVFYWSLGDFQQAAEWFARAARMPYAPDWLEPLAAVTAAQGGSRASSRLLWRQILSTAEDGWYKREAERRLLQLDAMDQIDRLREVAAAYAQRAGAAPGAWQDLIRAGYLRGVPLDPTGEPYMLSPGGHVDLAATSTLSPLPRQAGAM